jgi:DNA repair exonuclease SbcCD ATPase subunit
MEFQKYIDNLTNQLQLVNADIVEKQEELDKLKEFRSRIKGGMEVVKQIQTDLAEESTPLPLQQEIQQSIQELTQGRHGGDLDAL